MPVMKKISTLLGIILYSVSVLPVLPAVGQEHNNKSFTQWCQNEPFVRPKTRRTINILLKIVGTENCQVANSKLKKLTILSLKDYEISDIQPLSSLTNLTILSLKGYEISDIKPLSSLTNLTKLYFNNCQINDVKPLASLTNLKHLVLVESQISDIKPLASLTNLNLLDLGDNQISDVKPLSSLTNLTYLNLRHNQQIKKICPIKPAEICQFN
jgi:internalin A